VRLRQIASMIIAAIGLIIIGATVGADGTGVKFTGFALVFAASLSWAIGNVLVKQVRAPDMLALVCWLCFVPPLPLLALSVAFEGWPAISKSVEHLSPSGLGVILYLGLISTIFAYGLFGYLIRLYSAGGVAPFAFLVPVFGTVFAWGVFGETFSLWRTVGICLVLLALGILLLPGVSVRIASWRGGATRA
jgi:O-acetylserine/cysteine efflux transporter